MVRKTGSIIVVRERDDKLSLSPALVQLLVEARSDYHWPKSASPQSSQQLILDLEQSVARRLKSLRPDAAHSIIKDVSKWAGNNVKANRAIECAPHETQILMRKAIDRLLAGHEADGLQALCSLPGIRLVIASKIFRFCVPEKGAAVDRHASYFFNSLPLEGRGTACSFVREWSSGCHVRSRLAIYSDRNHEHNRNEYLEHYLPVLSGIAMALNAASVYYVCAVTGKKKRWRPADVEMAAYYWWANNGPK